MSARSSRADRGPAGRLSVLERLLAFSIRRPAIVIVFALGVAAGGAVTFRDLRIDAVPDITNVQVQINTITEGLTPEEVEQQVTYPIETAMAGIPVVTETRSFSRYGLSQVAVVFKDGTDVYFARQRVNENLEDARANLPPDAHPGLGPITTALGEIYKWTVRAKPDAKKPDGTAYTTTDLREIEDWIIRPQLRNIPGVIEISSQGGFQPQYHVTPDPSRMVDYGLTFQNLVDALEANNSAAGGGFVEEKGEQLLVNTSGRLHTEDDIRNVVVATHAGVPIRISDIGAVGEGQELRGGAAMQMGEEVVLGTAMMLIGENSRVVSKRVEDRLADVNRTLPAGIVATPVYSRGKLVDATIETVRTNLVLGAVLVLIVLLLLLGNFIGAFIVAMVIPLSLMFAITGMVTWGISANLLSLGAIDFGIIVDGAVVMLENLMRRLGMRRAEQGSLSAVERREETLAASEEVARPVLFGVAIIMIVYLPILTLTGIEGKMFRPMAQVVLLALTGALIFALTFVPAMAMLLFRGSIPVGESRLMSRIHHAYRPVLDRALARRRGVVLAALAFVLLCGILATRLGSEFIPTLDEGDIVIIISHIPGTGLAQTLEMERSIERTIGRLPEVATVFSQIGTGDVANDPMPPNEGDIYVILKPRKEWPNHHKSKETLIHDIEEHIDVLPGNIYEFTQPIEDRFNELIAGVTSDVAIKVFGDDLEALRTSAERAANVLRRVRGSADVQVEAVAGLPLLTVDIDHQAAARYGLSVRDIQFTVRTALAGTTAGDLLSGDRRFPIVVRLPERLRSNVSELDQLPVPVPAGLGGTDSSGNAMRFIPLGEVAHMKLAEGPNEIGRENGKRLVIVEANVRGRDLGGFVDEARQKVDREVPLHAGYWITWGGQFQNLMAAHRRLNIVVPLALLLIFGLLYGAFGSVKDALLVFSGVPLALTGGVLALLLRGMPFSITAAVGFIALSGVAVLNGLVMVSFIRKLRDDGADLEAAIRQGCETRLRPVLMTALVASLGFVPMAVATGTGAEVQRPLATVVIGGIVSSTLLTLVVLPALFRMSHRDAAS